MFHCLHGPVYSPAEGHLGRVQVLTTMNEHSSVFVWTQFYTFGQTARRTVAGCTVRACLALEETTRLCPKVLHRSMFPPAVNERSCCSTPSPALHVVSFLDSGHSKQCVVASYLNLHFPDDICCWASFKILICHLYIFGGEISVKVLAHILIR